MRITRILLFLFLQLNIFSCGDILDYKEKIIGLYYLSEVDSRGCLSVSYKGENGGFYERVPTSVIQYGLFNDSLLVVKTKKHKDSILKYYIINMSKDSEFSEISDFLLVPPLAGDVYAREWEKKLNIKFIQVPSNFLNIYR